MKHATALRSCKQLDINLGPLTPYEDENFDGSLVLNFMIWWRHVKAFYLKVSDSNRSYHNVVPTLLTWVSAALGGLPYNKDRPGILVLPIRG